MVIKQKKRVNYKQQSWIEMLVLLAIIAVANILAAQYYKKFDLTKEKRFTLSETSKQLAQKVEDRMYFKVYLEGENLSPKFKRLRTATLDLLQEFRDASGNKIDFEFVNVFENKDEKEKAEIRKQLVNKGLSYYNDIESESSQTKRNLILPCAEVFYGSKKEYPINLLTTETGMAGETAINKSIENLEYEIANSVRKCLTKTPKKIAFLYGHGEPDAIKMDDLLASLDENYSIDRVLFNLGDLDFLSQFQEEASRIKNYDSLGNLIIQKTLQQLQNYDGVVIVKPTIPYQKNEAYILDQYIMHGGKTVWMIDPTMAEHDSLRHATNGKVQFPDWNNENLRTMLFNYGVRLNSNILLDLNCNNIILPDPYQQGKLRPFPWVYYPVFSFDDNQNPITRNLEVVWGQYTGTLKPITRNGLKFTTLLSSSPRTKMQDAPVLVDLSIVELYKDANYLKTYNNGKQVVGVLMEGDFKSNFRRPDKIYTMPVKEECHNSMIVIADGDIGLNAVKPSTGELYPLGFDRETGRFFANKKFLLNCFDFLFDESGLIEVRSKEIGLRLLDKPRIEKPKEEGDLMSEKTYWQLINTAIPILIIVFLGILNTLIRKRKYSRQVK